jgi:hypothetical protein
MTRTGPRRHASSIAELRPDRPPGTAAVRRDRRDPVAGLGCASLGFRHPKHVGAALLRRTEAVRRRNSPAPRPRAVEGAGHGGGARRRRAFPRGRTLWRGHAVVRGRLGGECPVLSNGERTEGCSRRASLGSIRPGRPSWPPVLAESLSWSRSGRRLRSARPHRLCGAVLVRPFLWSCRRVVADATGRMRHRRRAADAACGRPLVDPAALVPRLALVVRSAPVRCAGRLEPWGHGSGCTHATRAESGSRLRVGRMRPAVSDPARRCVGRKEERSGAHAPERHPSGAEGPRAVRIDSSGRSGGCWTRFRH